MWTHAATFLLFCLLIQETHTGKNKNKQQKKKKGESGIDVVDAALEKLKKFSATGQKFLRNIACAESIYGLFKTTYRKNYHGGIWQVDKKGFDGTQDTKSHSKLKERYKKIKELYGIDWEKVKWQQLRDPFYSVLAARLLLLNKDPPLPPENDVKKQAEYWKKHYNSNDGKGTVAKFFKRLKECKKIENEKKEQEKEKAKNNGTDTEENKKDKGGYQIGGVEWNDCPIGTDVPERERLLPDPLSCIHFYHCNTEGWAWRKLCPIRVKGTELRLYWNNKLKLCDWPENVPCEMSET